MTAKRPGIEVVTNSSLGDKMDETAHRGKKFQKNSSFNTMTKVILQIHSAVLAFFWFTCAFECTPETVCEYIHIGERYPQGSSVHWAQRGVVLGF